MIYNSILDSIGNTPHVKLHQIGRNLTADLFVKCEFMNPGGQSRTELAITWYKKPKRRAASSPETPS